MVKVIIFVLTLVIIGLIYINIECKIKIDSLQEIDKLNTSLYDTRIKNLEEELKDAQDTITMNKHSSELIHVLEAKPKILRYSKLVNVTDIKRMNISMGEVYDIAKHDICSILADDLFKEAITFSEDKYYDFARATEFLRITGEVLYVKKEN